MLLIITFQIQKLNTADQFTQYINNNEYVFVKFFLDHCGHCRSLAPKFVDLEDLQPNAKLAQFDCEIQGDICTKYNVDGVPTLLLFKNGNILAEYTSEWRDPKPMNKWIKQQIIDSNKPKIENSQDDIVHQDE
uniref:Thioredoxin domain-containing protein n=1 Tax=Trepomonas sp. PC1 TaxID=1076344 RepID=A0A146KE81_9EUKA|eukprot:JAP93619.1 Thioredoxin domain-containing protein [Trepomonas sp. PC1]